MCLSKMKAPRNVELLHIAPIDAQRERMGSTLFEVNHPFFSFVPCGECPVVLRAARDQSGPLLNKPSHLS